MAGRLLRVRHLKRNVAQLGRDALPPSTMAEALSEKRTGLSNGEVAAWRDPVEQWLGAGGRYRRKTRRRSTRCIGNCRIDPWHLAGTEDQADAMTEPAGEQHQISQLKELLEIGNIEACKGRHPERNQQQGKLVDDADRLPQERTDPFAETDRKD